MEIDEKLYEAGNRAAWRKMLETACHELGYADSQAARASWHREREEAIIALREICSNLGDNDWPGDDLSITLGHLTTEFSVLFPRSQGPVSVC